MHINTHTHTCLYVTALQQLKEKGHEFERERGGGNTWDGLVKEKGGEELCNYIIFKR